MSALDRDILETKIQINSDEVEFKPSEIYVINKVKNLSIDSQDKEEEDTGEVQHELLEGEENFLGLWIIKSRAKLLEILFLVKISLIFLNTL